MKYIKYKRIEQICETTDDIQILLDQIITDGFEIIQYFEKKGTHDTKTFFFEIIIVVGKLRNNEKTIL